MASCPSPATVPRDAAHPVLLPPPRRRSACRPRALPRRDRARRRELRRQPSGRPAARRLGVRGGKRPGTGVLPALPRDADLGARQQGGARRSRDQPAPGRRPQGNALGPYLDRRAGRELARARLRQGQSGGSGGRDPFGRLRRRFAHRGREARHLAGACGRAARLRLRPGAAPALGAPPAGRIGAGSGSVGGARRRGAASRGGRGGGDRGLPPHRPGASGRPGEHRQRDRSA